MWHILFIHNLSNDIKAFAHLQSCEGWCNVHTGVSFAFWYEFWIHIQRCCNYIIGSFIFKMAFVHIYYYFIHVYVWIVCVCVCSCWHNTGWEVWGQLVKVSSLPSTKWDRIVRLGVKYVYFARFTFSALVSLILGFLGNTQDILCKICNILLFPVAHTLQFLFWCLTPLAVLGGKWQSPKSQCFWLFLDKVFSSFVSEAFRCLPRTPEC